MQDGLQSFADDDWVEDELSRLEPRPRRTRRRLLRAIEEDWSAEEEDLCAAGDSAASEELGSASHHTGSDGANELFGDSGSGDSEDKSDDSSDSSSSSSSDSKEECEDSADPAKVRSEASKAASG